MRKAQIVILTGFVLATFAVVQLQAQTLTHSLDSTTVFTGTSVSCFGASGFQTDNSHWRTFTLADFGVEGDYQVGSVDLGWEIAIAEVPGEDIPFLINFYTGVITDGLAALTLLESVPHTVPDGTQLAVLNFPGGPLVPAGTTHLVVEFVTFDGDPDGDGFGNALGPGSNNLGETDDTYISAADCGAPEPVTCASIGFPNMHLVMSVFEVNEPIVVAPHSFLVTRGQFVSGDETDLAVSDNMDLSLRRLSSDTQSRTEFEVKSTSPTATPTSFEFTLEGAVFARSNVVQTIELFDYSVFPAGAWVQIDTRAAARSPAPDSVVAVAATGVLSRFVETGTMFIKARVRYKSDSPRQNFSSNTDQTIWTIE